MQTTHNPAKESGDVIEEIHMRTTTSSYYPVSGEKYQLEYRFHKFPPEQNFLINIALQDYSNDNIVYICHNEH
jgi:hypothetical protein